ncbi:hypothetical protein F511_46748 [Dorcoceras hygrometricum]|uniref:Uncharacterized protein n=1 Tax=Dorcoceras hygrometricum TaxID=472368 RepID=A0A2Z6ZSP0_9LAMI|nr:hypothetical protein F511_46748 [Dorcoceras hygrometricum]
MARRWLDEVTLLADDLARLASAAGRWSDELHRTMARDGVALVAAAWPCVAQNSSWRRRRPAAAPASLRRCRDGWSEFF